MLFFKKIERDLEYCCVRGYNGVLILKEFSRIFNRIGIFIFPKELMKAAKNAKDR